MLKSRNAYIITNPMIAANRSAEVTLSKFLRVITPCFEKVTVIGGNLSVESDIKGVELISFDIVRASSKAKRLIDLLVLQRKMYSAIRHLIKKNEMVFFWIGDKMLLPYWAAKRNGAEINYFIYGNVAKEGSAGMFARLSSKLIQYMAERADYICMESESVIYEWPGMVARKKRIIHLYAEGAKINAIHARKNILGMVCRLTEGKHVLECISAMARVHKQYPEWKLEIIGAGKQQQECKKRIHELHAEDYISLLGWVEHDEVVVKSKEWRYLLFPTDTEGMPNGLLEMMGRGIPALVSPVGGIKSVVYDGFNGYILRKLSVDAIDQGIIRLIEEPAEIYQKRCEEAYETIVRKFSLDAAIRDAKTELNQNE